VYIKHITNNGEINMSACEFCSRKIGNKGSLAAHTKSCKNNPNRIKPTRSSKAGQQKGCIPWNKNKTFEDQTISRLINTIETGAYKKHSDTSIRRLVRLYLIHKHGHKCMLCGLSEWRDIPMPLVSDHIDGDSSNNDLDNFRIICNNCDATLPTFKGKNRGNGRKDRYN
jgi:hypothetical protein